MKKEPGSPGGFVILLECVGSIVKTEILSKLFLANIMSVVKPCGGNRFVYTCKTSSALLSDAQLLFLP